MPYIPKNRREELTRYGFPPIIPGELNYAITVLLLDYLRVHGLCYNTLNTIVGAMECAKLEFQRRIVAPYEDTKCSENGDVFPNL